MEEKLEISTPKLIPLQDSQPQPDETTRFTKSLQELKNLRSQLHYAADYSERTFFNSTQKKLVVDNTKEYVCRALVTVVDHLGNVSANLDHSISNNASFSLDAEIRIQNLKQRIQSCQSYAHKLALSRFRLPANFQKHHRRYFSMPISILGTSKEGLRDYEIPITPKITEKNELDTEDVPLFLYTFAHKSRSQRENSNPDSVLPVRDSVAVLSRSLSTSTFDFQAGIPRHRRNKFLRKTLQSKEIMSLVRRTKRASLELRK